ncbi:aldo/keto reductase [Streptomyces sp. NPDC059082]|uniref:aldo/keto reductase n=1 Tax=Streptomyces sp. NPDC059082 TaxID=3346720 RepID=UPI0036BA6243
MTSVTRIDTVRLGGQDGPQTGVQGFGSMGISEFYGGTDEAAARDTLEAALEAGVTLIDTADVYGSGANEEFLAPFLAAHRDEVTLATKFAIERRADDPAHRGVRNDPAYIRKAVEGSLRRLGIDTIDLYYMHRRDPEVPFAESVGAMAELVQQGKVRYLGLSEVTGPELREAHAVHPITALQSEWSLFSRDVERSAVGATPAQIALAWVQQRAAVHGLTVVPIPGTRKRARLLENAAATRITLTDAELAALEPIAGLVAGDRYPDMSSTAAAREV